MEIEGVIDVHYASLISQGVQHTVFYRDGHPSRYQPRPTGLNFGEQTGTVDFFLVIAVPANIPKNWISSLRDKERCMGQALKIIFDEKQARSKC